MGKAFKTIAGVLLLAILVSGCASNTDNRKSSSPSPSNSESQSAAPKVSPTFALNYSGDILLAKNDLEREFLTIALKSCLKAQTDGFIITDSQATTYFRPATAGLWPDWQFDEVSVIDGKASQGIFYDYGPAFLDPCNLEIQAQRVEANAVVLEHKVTSETANEYIWSQHQGGYSLESMTYQVADGLITGYWRTDNSDHVQVGYGPLTEDQVKLFDQVSQ
jgi:hypothetical protein